MALYTSKSKKNKEDDEEEELKGSSSRLLRRTENNENKSRTQLNTSTNPSGGRLLGRTTENKTTSNIGSFTDRNDSTFASNTFKTRRDTAMSYANPYDMAMRRATEEANAKREERLNRNAALSNEPYTPTYLDHYLANGKMNRFDKMLENKAIDEMADAGYLQYVNDPYYADMAESKYKERYDEASKSVKAYEDANGISRKKNKNLAEKALDFVGNFGSSSTLTATANSEDFGGTDYGKLLEDKSKYEYFLNDAKKVGFEREASNAEDFNDNQITYEEAKEYQKEREYIDKRNYLEQQNEKYKKEHYGNDDPTIIAQLNKIPEFKYEHNAVNDSIYDINLGQNPDEYYEGILGSFTGDDKYDYVTEDEKKTLNYLALTDTDKYNKYLDTLGLDERREQNHQRLAAEYADDNPVLAFATARANNALADPIATIGNVADAISGNGYNKYSSANTLLNEASVMDSVNTQKLEDKYGLAGEMAYGLASTTTDMGSSFAMGGMNKKAIQYVMSSRAFNSTLREANDRGITGADLYATATLAGAIEAVTEKYSIDAFFSKNPSAMKYLLKNFAAEGSEEMASDALNELVDRYINEGKSAYSERIRELMANGMSKEDAEAKYIQEFAIQVAKDGGIGALSGGLLGSAGAIDQANSNIKTGELLNNSNDYAYRQSMIDSAKELNNKQVNKNIDTVQNKLNADIENDGNIADKSMVRSKSIGERISDFRTNYKAGFLANSVEQEKGFKSNIERTFEELGEEDDDAAIKTRAVVKYAEGMELTKKEQKLIDNDENVQKVIDKVASGEFNENYVNTLALNDALNRAKNGGNSNLNNESNNEVYVGERTNNNNKVETAENEAKTTIETPSMKQNVVNISDKVLARQRYDAADVKTSSDVMEVSFDGDTMNVHFADGEVKPVTQTTFNDSRMESAYRYAQTLVDEEKANVYLANAEAVMESNANVPIETFNKMYSNFYNAGVDQATTYENFNNAYKNSADFGIYLQNASVQGAMQAAYNMGEGVGVDTRASKPVINLVTNLSKKLGVKVVLTDEKAENGHYDPNTKTIYISRYADKNLVSVLAHEYTHDMEQKYEKNKNSETGKAYAEYREALLDYYKDNGQYENLKKKILANGYTGENVDGEIVANATESFLLDEKVIDEICKDDISLAKKIKNFISKMIKDLKALLGDVSSNSKEANILEENLKMLEKAKELWTKAVKANMKENAESMAQQLIDNENTTVTNENGDTVAYTEDGTLNFSHKTWEDDGKDVLSKYLIKQVASGQLDKASADSIMSEMKPMLKEIKKTLNERAKTNAENKYSMKDSVDRVSNIEKYMPIAEKIESLSQYYDDYNAIDEGYGVDSAGNIAYALANGNTSVIDAIEEMYYDAEDYAADKSEEEAIKALAKEILSDYKKLTEDAKYSKKDSSGNILTESQAEYFKDSKAVDEDGNLRVVYHGTIREFYTFDKSFGNIEGDMGAGFYFTSSKADVERNYANENGADLTSKIEQEADMLEGSDEYEDMDHDEIVEKLREKYITAKEPITMESYLNIEKPCYVGTNETLLFSDYYENYNIDDYEDEDEYNEAIEQLIADDVESITYRMDNEMYTEADAVASLIYEIAFDGGIGLQELKNRLNELYIEDENGRLAANEVARIIVEELGYDGIIDDTVSSKFKNMGMAADTTHYIVFNSNQAKLTTNENPTKNEDVRYSVKDKDNIEYLADIMTMAEYRYFISELDTKPNEKYQKAKNGDYIVPISNMLIYTDMNKKNVGISSIIEMNTDDKTDQDTITNVIYNIEKGNITYGVGKQICENIFGEGIFSVYTTRNFGKTEKYDRPTERRKMQSDAYHAAKNQFRAEVSFDGNANIVKSNLNIKTKNTKKQKLETTYNNMIGVAPKSDIQKVVDEYAKLNGYNTKAFHGTNENFYVFDINKANKATARFINGSFHSENENVAKIFAGINEKIYGGKARVIKTYLKMENPLTITGDKFLETGFKDGVKEEILKQIKDGGYDSLIVLPRSYQNNELSQLGAKLAADGTIDPASPNTYEQVKKWAEENGYSKDDATKIHSGIMNPDFAHIQYAVFSPEQIKSADPITYDDNGNVIPLSERFNDSNPDIRYSLKDNIKYSDIVENIPNVKLSNKNSVDSVKTGDGISDEKLEKASQIISEGMKLLREQKKTGSVKLGKKYITKLANKYKTKYNSNIEAEQLEKNLSAVFAYIQSKDISYKDFLKIAKEISLDVVRSTNGDSQYNTVYKPFIDEVKKRTFKLTEKQKREIEFQYGTVDNFKRMASDYITISNNGIALKDAWYILSEKSGGYMPVSTYESDMPVELFETMRDMNAAKTNVENRNAYELAYELALEMYTDFFNEASRADKRLREAKMKLENELKSYQLEKNKEYQERVQQIEARKNNEIKKLEEEINALEATSSTNPEAAAYVMRLEKRIQDLKKASAYRYAKLKAEKNAPILESIEKQKLKNRIKKAVDNLSKRLLNPTEKQHIPVNLINAVVDLLKAVNLDTGRSATLSLELANLKDKYEQVRKLYTREDGLSDYAQETADMIDHVRQMCADKDVSRLSMLELEQLALIVESIKTQVANQNKLMDYGIDINVYDAQKQSADEIYNAKGFKNTGTGNALSRFVMTTQNAERFFEMTSGYKTNSVWNNLYKSIANGQREYMQDLVETSDIFRDVTEGNKNTKLMQDFISTEKKSLIKAFEDVDGKPVYITKAMRTELAMHMLNEDNVRHIAYGGLRIPNLKYLSKGDVNRAIDKGYSVRFVDDEKLRDVKEKMKDPNNTREQMEAYFNEIENIKNEAIVKAYDEINKLIDGMTEYEKKWLDDAKEYFHKFSGKKINETSMRLLGFKKAMVENYFPINTDEAYTQKEVDGIKRDATIEGQGFLKSRIRGINPINIIGIDSVLTKASEGMAKYHGLAIPMRDFKKVYVGKLNDAASVKNSLRTRFDGANDYIKNLITDIEAGRGVSTSFGKAMNKVRGNLAQATLSMNLGVTIKQAASLPTASAVLGHEAIMSALGSKTGRGLMLTMLAPYNLKKSTVEEMKLIKKYSPLLEYRAGGNIDSERASMSTERTAIEKLPNGKAIKNFLMNWINNVDTATVATLWKASEYNINHNTVSFDLASDLPKVGETGKIYVNSQNNIALEWNGDEYILPDGKRLSIYNSKDELAKEGDANTVYATNDLNNMYSWDEDKYVKYDAKEFKKGNELYYKKVADLFNKAVEQTQPNYAVLQRPDILRNPSELMKMMFMYKTQPLQNMGILSSAVMNLRAKARELKANPKNEVAKAEYKAALSRFSSAVSSQMVAATVFTVMTLLAYALTSRMKRYRDDDDEITFESIVETMLSDYIGTFAGSMPLGSEINSYISAKMTGNKYYGIEVSQVEAVNDLVNDVDKLLTSDYEDKDGKFQKDKLLTNFEKVVFDTSSLSGVPLKNAKNIVKGARYHAEDIENGEFGSFEASADRSATTNYRRYYKALKDDNMDKADRVHDDLEDAGKSDKTIYSGSGAGKLVKTDLLDGKISEDEAEKYLTEMGMDESDAHFKVMEWSTGESSDYVEVFEAIESMDRDKIISSVNEMKKYGYTNEKLQSASISKKFKSKYIELYNTDKTKAAELKSAILTYYQACGKDREKASKQIDNWLK